MNRPSDEVDKTNPKVKAYFKQMVESEPLKYVWNYVNITPESIDDTDKFIKESEHKDYMKNEDYKSKVRVLCNHLKQKVYFNKYTKVIEIKPELRDLLFYTKNQIFPRKPFYKQMFFNVDVEVGKHTVKGFYVEWVESKQDFQVLYVAIDKNDFHEFWGNFTFIPSEKDNQGIYVDNNKEERDVKKIRTQIRMVIANIIDFVNNPQDKIEIIHQERREKTNIKRLKNNKHPISDKMWLRPHPNYISSLCAYNEKLKCDYAFQVRGFWRHFHAERYKGKKPIWVDPFVKNADKEFKNKPVVMAK